MDEPIKLLIGIFILIIGFPLGLLLAKLTKEELQPGQKWFKLILITCIIGSVISLIIKNDVLLFSFLFIAIVSNGSLFKK